MLEMRLYAHSHPGDIPKVRRNEKIWGNTFPGTIAEDFPLCLLGVVNNNIKCNEHPMFRRNLNAIEGRS